MLGLEVLELRKQILILVKVAVNAAVYFFILLLICHEHEDYIFCHETMFYFVTGDENVACL